MADFEQVERLISGFVLESSGDDIEATFEDDNYCALVDETGNVIHLSFNPAHGTLSLMGALGKLPEDELSETPQVLEADAIIVMKFFLNLNLLWVQSGGATFAYVEDGDYMVIQRQLQVDGLTQEVFNQTLVDFSDALRVWINRYAQVLAQVERGDSMDEIEVELDAETY